MDSFNKKPQRKPKNQFGDGLNTTAKGTLYKGEYKPMKEIIIDVINNELIPNKVDIKIDTIFDFIKENVKDDFQEKTLHFNLGKLVKEGELKRKFRGVYELRTNDSYAVLLQGDGRDLSFLNDSELDGVYYDHAWDDGANKDPGKRKDDGFTQFKLMADFPTFQMEQKDMDELHRVLKSGRFCVLNLPKEGAENQEYLEHMLNITKFAGKKEYLDLIINLFNENEQQIIKDFGVKKLEDLKGMLEKMTAFKALIGEEKLNGFQNEFNKKVNGKHFKELEKKYIEAGFQVYAKIDWNKNTQINQGRVVKDREQLWFLTKGRSRDDLRINNKTRMKALDMVLEKGHKIHEFYNKGVSLNQVGYDESWIKLLEDIKSVNKDNRTKKRELLKSLTEHIVFQDYLDFFQKEELKKGQKGAENEHGKDFKDFQKMFQTINATMMGANGILPSEIKINKPKKGDSDFFGYSTEKPLKLQEIIIQFILMKGETMLEPATGGGSMMEAAINQGVNYIGIDISEKSIETCIERLKLSYKSIDELLKDTGNASEEELKEYIKNTILEYNESRKNQVLEEFNYQEKVYYPTEKIQNFKELLLQRGFDENNIVVDEFKCIVIAENEDKKVFGGNIYPFKDEILKENINGSYNDKWECIVVNK